jgi:membrane associated rhomboid family serine protease
LRTSTLFFNALCLWIFGSALERWWGERRFVIFWLITGIVGLLLGLALGHFMAPQTVMFGSSGATMAMVLAAGLLFPRHKAFLFGLLPLPVSLLAGFIGAVSLLRDLLDASYLMVAVELGGMAAALWFFFPLGKGLDAFRNKRAKRKFKVLDGAKKPEKKYLN